MAYCTSASVRTRVVGDPQVAEIDENVCTIPYLHDLTIDFEGKKIEARTYWDDGSNRILVNNEFARENNISPKPSVIIMKTAGGGQKKKSVQTFDETFFLLTSPFDANLSGPPQGKDVTTIMQRLETQKKE